MTEQIQPEANVADSVPEIHQRIHASVQTFVGEAPQSDDLTLLILERER